MVPPAGIVVLVASRKGSRLPVRPLFWVQVNNHLKIFTDVKHIPSRKTVGLGNDGYIHGYFQPTGDEIRIRWRPR